MNECSNANDEVCMASIGGVCTPTWIQWRDKFYKVTEPLPWSEARDECVKMGGVMATPNCEKEAQFLKAITPTSKQSLSSLDIYITGAHGDGNVEVKQYL